MFLGGDPISELLGRIDVDTEEHFGVLRAAVLGALAEVYAGFVRIDPCGIDAIGNEVGFSSELWNPKAVVGIDGEQFDESGRGIGAIADRNVEFIGSDDAESRVTELPPELMADGGDLDCAGGRNCILNGLNDARSGEEKNQDNKNGDDGPSQFHLIATVDLGWLAMVIRGTAAISNHDVDQKRENNGKDQAGNDKDKERKAVNCVGWSRYAVENTGDWRSSLGKSRREAEEEEAGNKRK